MEQIQVLFSTEVNPHGYATTLQFLSGTDPLALTPIATIDCGDGQGYAYKDFQTSFDEETTFYVKGVAVNEKGTVETPVVEFTTLSAKGAPEITEVSVNFV